MKIIASDIDDLALGAVFLATGGGGDPYLPTLIVKETLAQTGGVTLIDAQLLDDDAFVAPRNVSYGLSLLGSGVSGNRRWWNALRSDTPRCRKASPT